METNDDYKDERRRMREERRAMKHEHHFVSSNRALIGIVLVLAGLFLVMRNTGVFPDFIDSVVFSWPMLLVVIGLIMTLGSSEKTGGIIVMAVGGFFIIPLIFRETFHMYNMFWPSIFIIVGIIFIVSRRSWRTGHLQAGPVNTGPVSGDSWIEYVNIFSGGERQVTSQEFKGGKITSIFGGIELDLTKAQLATGDSIIELACIFGGATFIVPDNWFVTIEVTPILGGFSDSRKLLPGRTVDSSKHLVIRGAVVFGGGEIKSY
jgi:predicted membrane protein